MNQKNRTIASILAAAGMMLFGMDLFSSMIAQTRLYGKIQYAATTDQVSPQQMYIPITNIRIDLLKAEEVIGEAPRKKNYVPAEILSSIHADRNGYFNFSDVSEGSYFLRAAAPDLIVIRDLHLILLKVKYVNQEFKVADIIIDLTGSVPMQEFQIRVENTSGYKGENKWDWRIYIKAPTPAIDLIECVEYNLHPTFRTRLLRVCRDQAFDPEYPFCPGVIRGWGVFNVPVKLIFKDRRLCYTDHMLEFGISRRILVK
jgi:hypothetical protein